ncbi:helix-turn-helix transcriptional regulator [Sphingomonas cannabina]|uniref:ATP-binding protein n=1 Tax=Sphingomonas cannabina TaxID=2899123 RepID=UPI001F39588E|nr:winged helix-turn-helix domain-containing protein [Sphingomonas cannabina]UIJ46539.1 helix-turn-helix transcriptional regulator [Sphingomonas cannabina]
MADLQQQLHGERMFFGPFCLSPSERLLTRNGEPVEIGGRSFDLLVVLTEQPGRVLSKRELLKRVWSDVVVEDGSLRFHMAGLRKLLGDGTDGARYIATQVGVGYAFVAPVERHGAAIRPAPDDEARPGASSINVPARLPHLIGRERDVTFLVERVADTPLFTIVGAGGVGKTSLAIEAGHRLAGTFEGRVAFVDFSMLENPAVVPSMIAGAMGIAVQSEDPLAVILGHIRDRPFLLLLDNCEHVVEPVAGIVERIIEEAPGARVLATSREPLRVRAEHVLRLDALDYPEEPAALTPEQLLTYSAVQLFCERATAADSSLVIDEDAARLIADMCRRLGGMALPIELAAVRAATHGIAATARQLGERFSLGWSGRRTARPRQQTLQATLDWSYDLLTEKERIVLERLSVLVGPFSIDAALEVVADAEIGSDDVAAALDELAFKSLVAPDRSRRTGTYRLLEMTRAYAREKLLARREGESGAVARRHAAFFLAELEAVAEQDEDVLQDTRPLRQQLGNIRSALDWSFGRDGDLRIAVRLAAASAPVFLNLSHLIECRTWCARALAEIEEVQRGTAIELELQAALGISLMFTRGNSEAAGNALARALEIATLLDDRWNQLRLLGCLHIFHERIGEYAAAMGHAERAVQVAEAIGAPEAMGIAYSFSGISHHLAGDQKRARRELELSLRKSPPSARSRTIHYGFDHRNRSGIALARTLWLAGHADEAGRLARQIVREAAQLDHAVTHCIALIWSLSVYLWMEDYAAAEQDLAAFTECAEVNALGPYIAAAAGFRGELAIQRGQTGDALGAVEESLSRLRAARYELLTTPFSIALARGLVADSRTDEALDLVDATLARCDANGERFAVPELLRLKARIVRFTPSAEDASTLLDQALTLSREQGARAWELKAAADLAALR